MTAHCEWCPFPGCDSCAYKGWRRSEPAVIQTPDTRGPWDQRKAEAAAAGLAVAAILAGQSLVDPCEWHGHLSLVLAKDGPTTLVTCRCKTLRRTR